MAEWLADAMIVRRARVRDADAIATIYGHYVRNTDISFETEPPDAPLIASRIAACLQAELPWIVAGTSDGAITGYAYASRFHPRLAYRFTVEPTVYMARDATHRGVGTMLYERLLTILNDLNYREAIALVSLPNPASEALHARCGFHRSGTFERAGYKFDRWVDVGLFQKALGSGEVAPDETLPLGHSPSWVELG